MKTSNQLVKYRLSMINYAQKHGVSQTAIKYNTIGVNHSFIYRFKIANKNGIILYTGSSKQNTRLLDLLKKGKLVKP